MSRTASWQWVVGMAAALVMTGPLQAQTTFNWNYTATDWNSAGSWLPGGPPTAADTALFDYWDGTTFTAPSFSSSTAVGNWRVLGPRPVANYLVSGNGNTLTVGTGSTMTSPGFAFRGTFGDSFLLNNLQITVATGTTFTAGSAAEAVGAVEVSGFGSRLILQNGSRLNLSNAAGTANYALTISGGTVLLDATTPSGGTPAPTPQLTTGLGNSAAQKAVQFQGGGSLTLQGDNTSGTTNLTTTFALNQVAAQSGHGVVNLNAGFNRTNGSGVASLQATFGNGNLQSGIDRFIRDGTGTVVGFGAGTLEFATNGVIPGFSGAQAKLFLAPGASGIASQNGVITEASSSNTNSPYVILSGTVPGIDGTAGRFATWNSTTHEVTAVAGVDRTEATLSSAATNENVRYRPSSSVANATLANNLALQTVVLEPRANNQSVNLNGFTLTTPGVILSGRPFGISGTYTFRIDGGTLAGPAAADRNFFVLGGSTNVLAISANLAGSSSGAIVKAGGGMMALTGTTDQMAFTNITDVVLNAGIWQARIDGASRNFGTTNNTIHFRGGVLEVDANSGTSTFTRSLGNSAGQVNWSIPLTGNPTGDRGSGGFSVVNGNLNVNIGGAGQTLVWNGTASGNQYFLRSGQELRLGTSNQTGIVTLQNNLALDDGSAGLPRETRVLTTFARSNLSQNLFAEDAAVRSRITGVISGSAATRLIKSGPSTLELTAPNTYAGGTAVDLGVLQVSNTTGSATGTGPVVVTRGTLIGNGIIAPAAGNGVTITADTPSTHGFLIADSSYRTPGHLTIGTDGVNNPVTFRPGAVFATRVYGTTFDPAGGSSSYGRLTVRGTGAITVDGASLGVEIPTSFTPSSGDLFGILDNQTAGAINGTFAGVGQDGTVTVFDPSNTLVGTFRVSYTGDITGSSLSTIGGNDIVLYGFTPVPEPATVLGTATVLLGLGAYQRRRGQIRVTSQPAESERGDFIKMIG